MGGTFFLFLGVKNPRGRCAIEGNGYLISCSKASNSGVLKNSPKVISKPSHSFLIVMVPGFWLFSFRILYTVDGEMPDMLANSFTAICRSSHSCSIRLAITSFVRTAHSSFAICRKISLSKFAINRMGYIAFFCRVCYNIRYITKGGITVEKVCTFFGHRDCYGLDAEVLRNAIEDLIKQGVVAFYVGNHG